MNYFKKIIKKHASFLVIIVGAFSFFLSNIINKEIFTLKEYGYYSIFITYLSIIYIFGILGLEQNLLRFSFKKNDIIETQKIQIKLFYLVSIINTFLSTFLFMNFYSEINIHFLILLIASYCMISQLFLSNLFRINANFVLSQLASNSWKILLLLFSLIFFTCNIKNFETLIVLLSVSIVVIYLIAKFLTTKYVKIVYNDRIANKSIYASAFHFFISIFLFTILIFADRFIIEKKFSIEEFGNYFYLTNFFLAPFSIIQNYIGFKQLVHFKYNFTFSDFNRINFRNFIIGLFLACMLFIFSIFISKVKLITFDFNAYFYEILIILIIGVSRLISSSILSAFEAKAEIYTLRKSNLYIIIITIVLLFVAYNFSFSLVTILNFFLLLWILRSYIHWRLLKQQIENLKDENYSE